MRPRLVAVHLKNHHSFVADPRRANIRIRKVANLDRRSGFIPNSLKRLESLERAICNKLNHKVHVLGEPLVAVQIHCNAPDHHIAHTCPVQDREDGVELGRHSTLPLVRQDLRHESMMPYPLRIRV